MFSIDQQATMKGRRSGDRSIVPEARPAKRLDLYVTVHKALRACLSDTLVRLGRMDVEDRSDRDAALATLGEALRFVSGHLEHEDEFIHPALEARVPHGASNAIAEHVEHEQLIAMLHFSADALRQSSGRLATDQALALYRLFSRFVGETLLHVDFEETVMNHLLWEHFSDPELAELHDRLRESMAPPDVMFAIRWALPASSPAERAALVRDMQTLLPSDVLHRVLEGVRPHIDSAGWAKLGLVRPPVVMARTA